MQAKDQNKCIDRNKMISDEDDQQLTSLGHS